MAVYKYNKDQNSPDGVHFSLYLQSQLVQLAAKACHLRPLPPLLCRYAYLRYSCRFGRAHLAVLASFSIFQWRIGCMCLVLYPIHINALSTRRSPAVIPITYVVLFFRSLLVWLLALVVTPG